MFNIKLKIKNYFFKKKLIVEIPILPFKELPDVWIGDKKNGQIILQNINSIDKVFNLNSFGFIRDLKSLGTLETRSIARKIVDLWIDKNQNFLSPSFGISFLSDRIVNICFTYSWFAKSGNINFKNRLLKFLCQQMKIQELNIKLINNDNDRFKILKSLTIGNIFLFNEKEKILFYLKQIEIITKKLILKDGGHVSRNPRKQLKLLRELIEIRAATASIPEINNCVRSER